jgi:hypothetical protein
VPAVPAAGLLVLPKALSAGSCRLVEGLPEADAALVDASTHAAPPTYRTGPRMFVDSTVETHGQPPVGNRAHHLAVLMGDPDDHPHNLQVVLELDLADGMAARAASRAAHPDSLHTAVPPMFAQTAPMIDVPGHPPEDSFEELTVVRTSGMGFGTPGPCPAGRGPTRRP